MTSLTEQQRVAVRFPDNLLLTACPGSGKTRTLIAKLVAEIEPVRGSARGICAITYTKTAVQEIEQRAAYQLQPGDERYFAVSTIHAFCAGLLQENPLEAGVDPHFTIWDEDDSSAVRHEVILTLIREQICAGHPGVQALFRDLQLVQSSRYAPRHLAETVEAALRWLNGLGVDLQRRDSQGRNWLEERFAAQQARLSELVGRFQQGCGEVRQAFRALATIERAQGKNAQKLLQRIKGELASIEAALERLTVEAPADEAGVCDTLAELLKAGNLGNHPTDLPIRACLEEFLTSPWEAVYRVVPDERPRIEAELKRMADEERCCLVVTTGGTGPAIRDVTPEGIHDLAGNAGEWTAERTGGEYLLHPGSWDQPSLARTCAELGAALPLSDRPRDPIDPGRLQASVEECLDRFASMKVSLARAREWELETLAGRESVLRQILDLCC